MALNDPLWLICHKTKNIHPISTASFFSSAKSLQWPSIVFHSTALYCSLSLGLYRLWSSHSYSFISEEKVVSSVRMNHIRHAKYREQVVITLDFCLCSHISISKGKSCIFIYLLWSTNTGCHSQATDSLNQHWVFEKAKWLSRISLALLLWILLWGIDRNRMNQWRPVHGWKVKSEFWRSELDQRLRRRWLDASFLDGNSECRKRIIYNSYPWKCISHRIFLRYFLWIATIRFATKHFFFFFFFLNFGSTSFVIDELNTFLICDHREFSSNK